MNIVSGLNINDDVVIVEDVAWVHMAMERLLSIDTEEMVGALNQGTRIRDYIHETITDADILGILNEITNTIKYNMPMLVLEGVGVEVIPTKSIIGIVVTVEYRFMNNVQEKITDTINKIVAI